MKILPIGNWHLGKNLEGISRMAEQEELYVKKWSNLNNYLVIWKNLLKIGGKVKKVKNNT